MNAQPEKRGTGGKKLFGFFMVLAVLGLGIGIGTLVTDRVDATAPPGDSQLEIQKDGKPVAGGDVLALSRAFEEVASRMESVVVNINTEELITRSSMQEQMPWNPFFNPFFGPEQTPERQMPEGQMPERQQMRQSLGSGVIVDPKGYIVTNYHVIKDATRIKVSLADDTEYTAKVIGTDEISDIAVIKINGDKDFPFAKIGDSRSMNVGDWVIAIGSPFELDQTVTAGIISASGRTLPPGAGPSREVQYNDYLQTDAAINPGNSGGPLVNMNAEVVGINSFISTSSLSSAGVGFAVPSHLFVSVYNQILETGKFRRGRIGVYMNGLPFTPAMAKYFGVKQGSGVLVTKVIGSGDSDEELSPAAKAGILPKDVIVEFNGKEVFDDQDLLVAVNQTLPGSSVNVKAVRKGQEKIFRVTLDERTDLEQEESGYSFAEEEEDPEPKIGLEFDNVPPEILNKLKIDGGAYVTDVIPGTLADDAELSGEIQFQNQKLPGDIIISANETPIRSAQDLLDYVRKMKSGEAVILEFLYLKDGEPSTHYTSIVKP
jgi:serine protease Do